MDSRRLAPDRMDSPCSCAHRRRRIQLHFRNTFLVWLRFSAKADVVIEVEGIEPRLDVFAGFGVLPDVFGESGKRFSVAVRSALFKIC